MPVMAETVCMCGSEFLMCLCPRVTRVRLKRLQQAYTGGMSERERGCGSGCVCRHEDGCCSLSLPDGSRRQALLSLLSPSLFISRHDERETQDTAACLLRSLFTSQDKRPTSALPLSLPSFRPLASSLLPFLLSFPSACACASLLLLSPSFSLSFSVTASQRCSGSRRRKQQEEGERRTPRERDVNNNLLI